ncbi:hypothetical protein HK096_009999 [Nowakowskiella sp. JEL0078]|nr:hypothetical protein HK096_009999 [Nowakowskiella sp. JEL0078]
MGLMPIAAEAPMTLEEDEQIQRGFENIRVLDQILKEKSGIAKRIASRGGQSRDDDEFEEDFEELRSVGSFESRTFLTEPRFGNRRRRRFERGVDYNQEEGYMNSALESARSKKVLKGYVLGDFVTRNIVLGPEARYYCAMTEQEVERVELILRGCDFEGNLPKNENKFDQEFESLKLPGEYISNEDREKIAEIDK